MELKKIKENIYYIPNSTNIGVIKNGENAILIDSGLDDDTGKKVLKLLNSNGMQPMAIVNTHSHADHCGGNSYIKEKTGAVIYAPVHEGALVHYPYFEPFFLFSGANPVKELTNKFLMAKPSKVDFTIECDCNTLRVESYDLNIIKLPGHAVNQISVEVNGVLFCGDFVYSKEILEKHKIPFCANIEAQICTMNNFVNNYEFVVPSHGEPVQDLRPLIDDYMEIINRVEAHIISILSTRKTTAEVFMELCCCMDIEIKSVPQYYLMNTAIMAYLSWLNNKGSAKISISGNVLYWQRVNV